MLNSTTDINILIKDPHLFTWGKILKFHHIDKYDIIEYHPHKIKGSISTNKIDDKQINFHCYYNKKDLCICFKSLDEAIANCIAIKYDGINTQAGNFFIKMINKS